MLAKNEANIAQIDKETIICCGKMVSTKWKNTKNTKKHRKYEVEKKINKNMTDEKWGKYGNTETI